MGCEEMCGKVKKYFDEILRHWLLIGCKELCGKVEEKTLMKFWDTGFWLAAKKREENSKKILWWNFVTLGFDWLRGNVWVIEKYFNEILRHSFLMGCEEMCGKVKNYFDEILQHWLLIGCKELCWKVEEKTLMKIWDTGFWLAAKKREENSKKKYFDEIPRHSVLTGGEETCGKFKNTLMKFWDTGFWLTQRKREEN